MPSPPRLIFLVNSAARRLQQCIAARQLEAAKALGVAPSAAQGGVLFVLDKGDGATMGELALALDLAPSAVSGLIARMEALAWVARKPCPDDARTQRAWLLPAGRRALPTLHQALARLNRQLKAGFSDEELQTVARWLRHVQQLDETTP
jgi:DNA-binding MarR family transcriptional regulator